MIVYIVNGHVTIKNIDDRSYRGYFMVYAATTEIILYWKPDQTFLSIDPIMISAMRIIIASP